MDISVIIPFYKGDKYLDKLLDMMEQNQKYLKSHKMEVIFVNDNPDDELKVSDNKLDIKIINNDKNLGIHQSRVKGLNIADGEYILFLDQDDIIDDHFLISHINTINNHDLCIGNGIMENENGNKIIYKTKKSQDYLKKQIGFIKVRDLIVSPGQCLIKKSSIPTYWKENFMKVNSADDYMLWLLMIDNKCSFTVNYEKLYIHKYTGMNISGDLDQVYKSNMEMIDLISNECHNINMTLLKRTIQYKYDMKKIGKLIPSLKNIDLFLYNMIYQLFWKGM